MSTEVIHRLSSAEYPTPTLAELDAMMGVVNIPNDARDLFPSEVPTTPANESEAAPQQDSLDKLIGKIATKLNLPGNGMLNPELVKDLYEQNTIEDDLGDKHTSIRKQKIVTALEYNTEDTEALLADAIARLAILSTKNNVTPIQKLYEQDVGDLDTANDKDLAYYTALMAGLQHRRYERSRDTEAQQNVILLGEHALSLYQKLGDEEKVDEIRDKLTHLYNENYYEKHKPIDAKPSLTVSTQRNATTGRKNIPPGPKSTETQSPEHTAQPSEQAD